MSSELVPAGWIPWKVKLSSCCVREVDSETSGRYAGLPHLGESAEAFTAFTAGWEPVGSTESQENCLIKLSGFKRAALDRIRWPLGSTAVPERSSFDVMRLGSGATRGLVVS